MKRKRGRPKKNAGKTASDHYQYRIVEIGVPPQNLHGFSNDDSIASVLRINTIDERLIELREKLMDQVWVLIDTCLTPHQRKVMGLHLDGYTQNEIGEVVGASQSAVHKTLHGNLDYQNKRPNGDACRYGGAVKKLEKYARKSEKIKAILEAIEDIKKENNNDT